MRWLPKRDFTKPPKPKSTGPKPPPAWPWVVGFLVLLGLITLFVLAVVAGMSQMGG